MEEIARVNKAGFETGIPTSDDVAFIRVDALDIDGNVIGFSNVVNTSTGESVGPWSKA